MVVVVVVVLEMGDGERSEGEGNNPYSFFFAINLSLSLSPQNTLPSSSLLYILFLSLSQKKNHTHTQPATPKQPPFHFFGCVSSLFFPFREIPRFSLHQPFPLLLNLFQDVVCVCVCEQPSLPLSSSYFLFS
jgi:hypothetical protein